MWEIQRQTKGSTRTHTRTRTRTDTSRLDIRDLIQALAELTAVPHKLSRLRLAAPHTLFISLLLFVALSLLFTSAAL